MSATVLKNFALQQGLTYDPKRRAAFGDYHGYQTVIHDLSNQKQYILKLSVNGPVLEQGDIVTPFLQSLGRPYVNYSNYENLTVTVSVKAKNKKDLENLSELMNTLTDFFRMNSLSSCCKYCGAQSPLGIYSVNGQPDAMCEPCFGRIQQNLTQAQQQIKEKKGNVFFGIVGALLFSLVGVVLWVIIGQFGYIAGICGLITVVCAMKGYEKLGGKLDLLGVILTVIISIVMIFVAEEISLGIQIYTTFQEVYPITIFDAFSALPQFMQEQEVIEAVIRDLLMGYVLMAVASVGTIINVYRNKNLKHEVSRLQ